jgi:carbonic anhydrase
VGAFFILGLSLHLSLKVYNPSMLKKTLQMLALICFLTVGLAGNTLAAEHAPKGLSPDAALQLLVAGNQRFASGKVQHPHQSADRRKQTAKEGQRPYAIILGCSDSRVPPELVFDAGIGDLFSVRVAGNVADKVAVGSIEYAVDHLGATLIMVLGHTKCGAVSAAVGNAEVSSNIASITNRIEPAVAKVKAAYKDLAGDALLEESVKANVRESIEDIVASSPDLRQRLKDGKIRLIGALYDLGSGLVTRLP